MNPSSCWSGRLKSLLFAPVLLIGIAGCGANQVSTPDDVKLLAAAVQEGSQLEVGVTPTSIPVDSETKLTFSIKNDGSTLLNLSSTNTNFTLKPGKGASLGSPTTSDTGWILEKNFLGDWTFSPKDGQPVSFDAQSTKSFSLDVTASDAGALSFSLEGKLDGDLPKSFPHTFTIQAERPKPIVKRFTAYPSILVSGTKTTITWDVACPAKTTCTTTLQKASLSPEAVDSSGSESEPLESDTSYKLIAEAKFDPPTTAHDEVMVHVREEKNWYPASSPASMNVPTVLIGDNKAGVLYGIFVRLADGQIATSGLWANSEPLDKPWQQIATSYQPCTGQPGQGVPPHMLTSSGVYFDDALYLIGGSVVVNGQVSNETWMLSLSSESKTWQQLNCGDNELQERSGQTVLVYNDAIWMLGGYDVFSNPLGDVWAFENSAWHQKADMKVERGLLAAVAIDNSDLLVFGGFSGYQQQPYSDLWKWDGSNWSKQTFNHALQTTAFTSFALQQRPLDQTLYLMASRISNSGRTSQMWQIDDKDSGWLRSPVYSDMSWSLSDLNYSSVRSTNFSGVIWVYALGVDSSWPQKLIGNTAMYYFVPSPPQTGIDR